MNIFVISVLLFCPSFVSFSFNFLEDSVWVDFLTFQEAHLMLYSGVGLFNRHIFSNSSLQTYNDTKGASRVNISGMIEIPFSKIKITGEIKSKSLTSKVYDNLIWRQNMDTCNVQKGVIGNFILKAIIDNIHDCSNYKFECPQPTGFFYVANFPIEIFSNYIPRSLFGLFMKEKPMWQAVIIGKIKMRKSKPLVQLFSWKFTGLWSESS